MKIQNLAVIFVIIVLPISLVLSKYMETQIKTINMQSSYDSKLINSTYDAIKTYQINTVNNTERDIATSKIRDIEASANSFFTSVASNFGLSGYNANTIKDYVPALVYTMYDGYYIYAPFTNTLTDVPLEKYEDNKYKHGQTTYGLKPYIYYSCRYYKDNNNDIVVTYALDNYITIQGKASGKIWNTSGYLIHGITKGSENVGGNVSDTYTYNDITFRKQSNESLEEYVADEVNKYALIDPFTHVLREKYEAQLHKYNYVKINGTKYYLKQGSNRYSGQILYFLNGKLTVQVDSKFDLEKYQKYYDKIYNNNSAYEYYQKAYNFTNDVTTKLSEFKASDAIDSDGNKIFSTEDYKIFADSDILPIQEEGSNFNRQRKEIIRYTIETNLESAISNFNRYTDIKTEFTMPKLKETEWEQITNDVSLISFLQGFNIGGKKYNGHAVVTNDLSGDVVTQNSIYIVTENDKQYHRVLDTDLKSNNNIGSGVLNLDFEQTTTRIDKVTFFHYAKRYGADDGQAYTGCYSSIINPTNVINSKTITNATGQPKKEIITDIDKFLRNIAVVEKSSYEKVKRAYYTALARERESMYRANNPSSPF